MTNSYRITPRVQQDLKKIGHYTLKMWGREQRNLYLRSMEKRFEWLAERHYRGQHRPDVGEGFHSYPKGSHVVFYLIREGGIDIIGIPHQRMEIMSYF